MTESPLPGRRFRNSVAVVSMTDDNYYNGLGIIEKRREIRDLFVRGVGNDS